jgi:gliding motility-associated-like protein
VFPNKPFLKSCKILFRFREKLLLLLFILFLNYTKGQLIYTIAGNGFNANQGSNIPAVCAPVVSPHGSSLDGLGHLYLTCGNSIRKVNLSSGVITYVAGSDTWGHTGDGGPAINATLQFPFDLDMDINGNLYISEYGGYIRKINTNTGIISTVAGNGTAGFSGDGGPASGSVINQPWGICTDINGNIYFADNNNSRIRKIEISTGIISTVAGNGATTYSGDGGLAINAGIPYPHDVTIDGNGHLYIVEVYGGNTSRVRKVNAITGIISTVAGNGIYAYSGDGGSAIAASLYGPAGVAVDGSGNIYIAEYDDSRIRKVDAITGIINTIGGNGINGFSGDGGPAINASLHYPIGIEIDTNGDIYICDSDNNRIRKISASITLPPSLIASVTISSSPADYCAGTPVTFTASLQTNGANPVYSWFVNGTQTSTNSVSFTSSSLNNGDIITCKALITYCGNSYPVLSNSVTVQFGSPGLPVISISANDTNICAGENVLFTATAQDAGSNPIYQWMVNGVNMGTNSNTFSTTTLIDGDKINCLIITDPLYSCGSTLINSSDTIIMIVSPLTIPSVNIFVSGNDICPGNPVTLTAIVSNAGVSPAYTWKLNGVVIGSNNQTFNSNNFSNNDIVICELTPGAGSCSNLSVASSVTIKVKPLPAISIVPTDTTVSPGSQLVLQAFVSGSINSFQWTPSANLVNSSTLIPQTIPVYNDIEYDLTVISADGCVTSAKCNIKVYLKLFMPTAFTPNNDGINDIFRIPKSANLSLKEFSIYDRWGNKVFATSDIGKGWNGIYKGVTKESGVYVYYISGTDDKGSVSLKGTFVLIR